MPMIVFLSAVSDEFHKSDPAKSPRFKSYRDILAKSPRQVGLDYVVTTQEDLVQGVGDLLEPSMMRFAAARSSST